MGVLNVVIGVKAVLLLFLMSMHLSEAGRVLLDEEEKSTKNKLFVLMESKKGPTPPDGSNQGTNIPNPTNGHAASTINERNFAGHTSPVLTSDLMELKKDTVPAGGPNPVTNIPSPANPAKSHAASTINERNFAGHTSMPPPYANSNFKSPVQTSDLMELKKGAVPPSGPNPRTNIPSPANPPNGHVASTINERNFAGHTTMPPPYANPNSKSPALTSDLMESKKDAVPPSGPNPRTNIPSPANPTNGHVASTINERNFAGHTTMPPPYANPNSKSPALTRDLMESKKDSVPPSGPNPRTNIPSPANPTNGHVASTINERNFAGHTTMPPPYANPNSKSPALTSDLMESKNKAPVPCGPNPGTNIPRPSCPSNPTNGLVASTINERNFAGHTTMPPPYAYPNFKSPVLTGVVMNQK